MISIISFALRISFLFTVGCNHGKWKMYDKGRFMWTDKSQRSIKLNYRSSLEPIPSFLVVGDSITLGLYSACKFCNGFKDNWPTQTLFQQWKSGEAIEPPPQVPWSYDMVYVSDWNYMEHMMEDVIPDQGSMKGHLDVVMLNFADLHQLHMGNHSLNMMNVYFEAMMEREVDSYIKILDASVIILVPQRFAMSITMVHIETI